MVIDNLPNEIPIFPLSGALLLPEGNLPLNIFEPRYIEMTDYAMANEKLIGMIQENHGSKKTNNLYTVGCLGKITQYNETNDGRYLINLNGITRFKFIEEIKTNKKFRKLKVDYSEFKNDYKNNYKNNLDKDKFLDEVKVYLSKNNININWDIINNVDLTVLVTTLASICPFSNAEKQIILECSNTDQIPNIMLNLFKMSDEEFNKKSLN